MKRTLEMFVKDGEPVHFPCTIESDKENANMYIMRLITPDADPKKGIQYKKTCHIFTEKELSRASVRYFTEYPLLDGLDPEAACHALLGYIGTRTYLNKNGVLTTRFLIRFDGTRVANMGKPSYIGLFTAREIVRSMDRMEWVKHNFRCPICRTIWRIMRHV